MSASTGSGRKWRGALFPWVSAIYLTAIYGVPTQCVILLAGRLGTRAVIVLPMVWITIFLAVAGMLSLPHQSSIVAGKFRRDVGNSKYFHRRLYGLCWTAVFYNKPAYFVCLSLPFLKWMTFRMFGYRGGMNFTVYPDTWIRDLPLLTFEDGVYVSNRATLGTNIVMGNGFLLCDRITLRRKSLVGHLAMLPGVELEAGAEVGVGAAIGIRSTVQESAVVGARCGIAHGVRIERNANVGPHTYIESGSVICEGVTLPARSNIVKRGTIKEKRPAESLSWTGAL